MRKCQECNLCCRLVPVRDKRTGLDKDAGERCRHQSHAKGCRVYNQPAMPRCCQLWNCRWILSDPGTENLSRPDRSGVVLDVMPDFITTIDNETGAKRNIEIVQVWVSPKRPDAYKDPALLAYLAKLASKGVAALIRRSATDAFVLAAPALNGGEWAEVHTTLEPVQHSAEQIVDALGGVGQLLTKGEMRI